MTRFLTLALWLIVATAHAQVPIPFGFYRYGVSEPCGTNVFEGWEFYRDGAFVNGGSHGCNWSAAWVDAQNPFNSIGPNETFESYSDAADLGGLNGGTLWNGVWMVGTMTPPTFSPDFITAFPTNVTISGAAGASFYYTVNGSTPTTGSTLYTSPVTISSATTLKAIAVKSGYVDSDVTSTSFDVDADLNDWIARVQGQGSDVTGAKVGYMRTYINGLHSDGVWVKLKRHSVFVGDGFNANKAPLINLVGAATDTLQGFVSGDWSLTTGLTGNGSTKWIDPTIPMNTTSGGIGDNNFHMGVYVRVGNGNAATTMMGAQGGGLDTVIHVSYSGTTYFDANVFSSSRIAVTDSNGTGFYIGTRTSISSSVLYKNGSSFGTDSGAGGARTSENMLIFGMGYLGTIYFPSSGPLELYTFGLGLTATDTSNLTSRYSTLRSSLGR